MDTLRDFFLSHGIMDKVKTVIDWRDEQQLAKVTASQQSDITNFFNVSKRKSKLLSYVAHAYFFMIRKLFFYVSLFVIFLSFFLQTKCRPIYTCKLRLKFSLWG